MGKIINSTFVSIDGVINHMEAWHFAYPGKINTMRKYVVSGTIGQADWANTTVINGDLVAEVARLRQQDGDIMMHGFGVVILSYQAS